MLESTEKAVDDAIDKLIRWVSKPFKKKMKLRSIVGRWFLFMLVGFAVMGTIQFFARYDFKEADTLASETGVGCDKLAMLILVILPPLEELIFRIMPHRYMGNEGAFMGSIIWAFLHLFGRNIAIVGFQLVMGIFYFKVVASGKYKEAIVLHELFNILPLSTCFMF